MAAMGRSCILRIRVMGLGLGVKFVILRAKGRTYDGVGLHVQIAIATKED